ncbi:MAG TPA: Na-translocating system protein MpsB, partial [Cyclobacteriaceae bacterium]|nr:Na-translocating system protein MpsB [Cyclobacteriaceae bacterium]
MKADNHSFDEHHVLHDLKHFLPAQAPLKDFIHHNTLHGFQNLKFDKAIYSASTIFGYRVSLSLAEYRSHYQSGRIASTILEKVIAERKGKGQVAEWKYKLLNGHYHKDSPRISSLRSNWK